MWCLLLLSKQGQQQGCMMADLRMQCCMCACAYRLTISGRTCRLPAMRNMLTKSEPTMAAIMAALLNQGAYRANRNRETTPPARMLCMALYLCQQPMLYRANMSAWHICKIFSKQAAVWVSVHVYVNVQSFTTLLTAPYMLPCKQAEQVCQHNVDDHKSFNISVAVNNSTHCICKCC